MRCADAGRTGAYTVGRTFGIDAGRKALRAQQTAPSSVLQAPARGFSARARWIHETIGTACCPAPAARLLGPGRGGTGVRPGTLHCGASDGSFRHRRSAVVEVAARPAPQRAAGF